MFSRIIDFIQKSAPHYKDRELIESLIKKHIRYGTFDFEIDDSGEFIFVCRWNISGDTATVLDLIINKKYKGFKTIKWIIARNWVRFPYLKNIEWDRETKYPKRKRVKHLIKEVL